MTLAQKPKATDNLYGIFPACYFTLQHERKNTITGNNSTSWLDLLMFCICTMAGVCGNAAIVGNCCSSALHN